VEAGPCQRTCTRFGWTFLTENSCSCDPPDILSRRESIPFVQDYAHVCESKFPGQSWLCISTDLILQEECHRKEKEYSAGRTVYVKDSQTASTKMKQQRKHQAHPGLETDLQSAFLDGTRHIMGVHQSWVQSVAPWPSIDSSMLFLCTEQYLTHWIRVVWGHHSPTDEETEAQKTKDLLNSWHLKPMFLAAVLWAPTHPVIFLRTIFNF
jgi:hypothetical protein